MAYTESHVHNEPLINLVCEPVALCGKSVPAVSDVPMLLKNQRRRRNKRAALAKAKENAELREEGQFVKKEEEEIPREEAEAPKEKRRVNTLEGNGDDKEEAVSGLSKDKNGRTSWSATLGQIKQTAWLVLW